jgi:hypothetical protein
MSKALQEQINQLFEETKDLMSLEEIKPYCDRFNQWVSANTKYSTDSLGTVLSRYGFYKLFKSLKLEQGKNADTIPIRDKQGNIKGYQLRHYAVLLCGLDEKEWKERNDTTRVIERLGNDHEIDPDAYLQVTGQLLESSDPHELAVGLIAATGRRPHEILARGKFVPLEGQPYQVQFEGQGKKRDEKPVFPIATLYPADYIIKCLSRLRREASTKALLKEVAQDSPKDLAAQNQAIDSRRNGSLNRVVREAFGNQENAVPILAFRHGEEQGNCKALRAAYAALATERDCDRSVGSKMLHYARLLGHFVSENPTDKELQGVATSLGYADYFTSKPVPFPTLPQKEKVMQVRVTDEDYEAIKQLQHSWKLPNQQSVVTRLIERQEKNIELGKQLQEYKTKINQLENQLKKEEEEMSQVQQQAQPQQVTVTPTELEAMIGRMIEDKLQQVLSNVPVTQQVNQSKPAIQAICASQQRFAIAKEPEVIEFSGMSNADLWTTKVRGASEKKILRSYQAICLYNDTMATGDNDRLAITNQALRELSGVNGLLVGDWIKAHADQVISHNSKYQMQNAKDPSKTETYYNKRHGSEKITKILNLINEQFLEGEALKSQQGKSS